MNPDDMRKVLLQVNPKLSKFNPLPRILFYDDFDEGYNGWCELIGNHSGGDLATVRSHVNDLRPPQISNCTFFDIGTHGSVEGAYALKLATRARSNHMSQAIKRLTFVQRGLVQFETYFTFKSEAVMAGKAQEDWDGNYDASEALFGDFTISNDVNEGVGGKRYHCALRYMNTDFQREFVQKWMYKTSLQPTTKMQLKGMDTPFDYHTVSPEDWGEVPGGYQPLCYNEVPTKINWHYLRWLFDTEARRNVELQVNTLTMDLRDVEVPLYDHEYVACEKLLNFCVDVRTHTATRNFFFMDSALVSVDW